jgi:aminobenzoyl-glutamate utilization protein B
MVGIPRWSEEEESLSRELQEKTCVPVVGLQKEIKPLKEARQNTSCNDSGCVSWVVPTGRINIPANFPGYSAHTWAAGVALATTIAHKGEVYGAKVLAASMIDLFMDEVLLYRVKEAFRKDIGETKYLSILPKDQAPPVDLNRSEMERWRPLMEKFYVKDNVEWQ